MKNLAGVVNADDTIRLELEGANIPIKQVEPDGSEVPYTLIGTLGEFVFYRAWYYMVALGLVPLAVAQELYENEIGKKDVRVVGHCGCPPPEEWAQWITPDGRVVRPSSEEAEFSALKREYPSIYADEDYIFSDDPTSIGAEQFVTSYHIDSEDGLRLFADALRAHNLVTTTVSG